MEITREDLLEQTEKVIDSSPKTIKRKTTKKEARVESAKKRAKQMFPKVQQLKTQKKSSDSEVRIV